MATCELISYWLKDSIPVRNLSMYHRLIEQNSVRQGCYQILNMKIIVNGNLMLNRSEVLSGTIEFVLPIDTAEFRSWRKYWMLWISLLASLELIATDWVSSPVQYSQSVPPNYKAEIISIRKLRKGLYIDNYRGIERESSSITSFSVSKQLIGIDPERINTNEC